MHSGFDAERMCGFLFVGVRAGVCSCRVFPISLSVCVCVCVCACVCVCVCVCVCLVFFTLELLQIVPSQSCLTGLLGKVLFFHAPG